MKEKMLNFFRKTLDVVKKIGIKALDFFKMVYSRLKDLTYKWGKKKTMIIVGSILGGILLIILLVILFTDVSLGVDDAVRFKTEYEELNGKLTSDNREYPKVNISSENLMKYSDVNEIVSLFENNGDGVVYFGYPSCPYCRVAVEVLCNTAEGTNLDKIYYVDVEQQGNKFDKLYEKLGDEIVENIDGKKTINAPLVMFLVDGLIVGYNKGTLFSQESPYDLLDQSQIDGLSMIYQYGIDNIVSQ